MRTPAPRVSPSPTAIVVSIGVAILVLGLVAYLDERRQAAAALDDFAHAQVAIARGAAAALASDLDARSGADARANVDEAIALLAPVAEPSRVVVLVRPPGSAGLVTTDGRAVIAERIREALEHADQPSWVRLGHEESAALGLPARTSIAGVARARDWGVAVVGTARSERDRQIRAAQRLVLGFAAAAALILGFGLLALSRQKRELALEHRLALELAAREHDDHLARASKLASLGALAIGIAHELATPLAVISGRAEQLAGGRTAADPRAQRSVAIIGEQAAAITRALRAFIGFVRGEAPRVDHVGAEDVAQTASSMVAHRVERAGGALVLDVAPNLPALACDRSLVEQALVNLLLRACEAIGAGGTIELSVEASARSVLFRVDDDGERDEVALRRTLSWRAGAQPVDDATLGLVIADEVARHHGGSLAVRARTPRGTRVYLELPADSSGGTAQSLSTTA